MTRPATSPSRQRGLSLLGLLVFGVVLVMVVVLGMRVLPTALEFMAVKRAVAKVSTSGVTGTLEIQKAFDMIAAVDDISSITGRDLVISRNGPVVTLSFRYEKRIPLFGPASLVIDYEGSSSGQPK